VKPLRTSVKLNRYNLDFVLSHCSLCPEADLSTFKSVHGGCRRLHHVASSAHRLLTAAWTCSDPGFSRSLRAWSRVYRV